MRQDRIEKKEREKRQDREKEEEKYMKMGGNVLKNSPPMG